jgi:sodium transport system permease protein
VNQALIVFKKEVREMLRDKRVRSAMFFGPVFSIVLMMFLFGVIFSSVKKASKTTIHVVKSEDPATIAFIANLKKSELQIKEVESTKAAEEGIKKGDIRLALDFGDGMSKNPPFKINAMFDPGEQKAQIALAVIEKVVQASSEEVAKQIVIAKGIDPVMLKSLQVVRKEVKVGETKSNEFLVQLLPYLIVIWCFYGAFSSASDIVSGEKERQTLETLLISPAKRNQIAIGKLGALAFCSICATVASLASILLMYLLPIPLLKPLFEDGLGLTFTGFLVILATMLPTVALFASMLLAVSAFARNTREAQTYLAQASIIVMLPAVFSQVIGLTDFAQSKLVYAIPILNSANVIRNALQGKYDTVGIALTMIIGLTLAAAAMSYAIRLFHRESILNRI